MQLPGKQYLKRNDPFSFHGGPSALSFDYKRLTLHGRNVGGIGLKTHICRQRADAAILYEQVFHRNHLWELSGELIALQAIRSDQNGNDTSFTAGKFPHLFYPLLDFPCVPVSN